MATIAALAHDLSRSDQADRATPRWAIDVAETLPKAEAAWRELESATAFMSPYGRFDWVAAFGAAHPGEPVRTIVVRDGAGRPALVLPVVVGRNLGCRIARGVAGKHANFNVPLMRPEMADTLTSDAALALLRTAGRRLGVDAFAFPNVPLLWNDRPNPFAVAGQPSPSDAWSLRLEPDGEATLNRSMSTAARKKLRNKARNLAKLGPVDLIEARTTAEVDLILDAFWQQKEERFRELGIVDPFADPGMRDFIRTGALSRLAEGCPPIELYGLTVAGRVVAVLGGAADRRRLSGMFVSFDGGEAAKFSPGEIIVTSIIRLQCERGRAVFDLGVGDARYKQTICDQLERLVDVTLPVTLRGRVYGVARRGLVEAKRRIKASPRAMRLATTARRWLAAAKA